jgi:hypothetical protein
LEAIAEEKALAPEQIEVWFADEARIGQKNKITRRWAKRGTRPSAPSDQRTASTYIFGAICPKDGKGAGLVLPHCNTESMSLHLAEIATQVAQGARLGVMINENWYKLLRALALLGSSSIALLNSAIASARLPCWLRALPKFLRALALLEHVRC